MSKITEGSSKSNVVGDVSIDFARYVEATKIFSLSLPLKNSKSDAILHVKIQRVLENDSMRNVEKDNDANNVGSDNKILKEEEPLDDIEEEEVDNGSKIKAIEALTAVSRQKLLPNTQWRMISSLSMKEHTLISRLKRFMEKFRYHNGKQLKKRSEQLSDSLDIITKYELHTQNLEQELEKQAEGFEADLETVSNSRIEQQQKAIKAEDALRKIRLQNASTVERLQKEFRKLSVQMMSTSEANERIANKAMTEASELRLEKLLLEEMLLNDREHLKIVNDQYEEEIHELEQELQHLKGSMEETEYLLEHWSRERNEMEFMVASLRKEADEFMDNVIAIGNLEEEKKTTFANTKSELENLRLQCLEFNQHCSENSSGKQQIETEERNTPIIRDISNQNEMEMEMLREKYKCMEDELNEMQRRYSGLSLNFAEVEGERQQLIMTLRNLKNPKKIF